MKSGIGQIPKTNQKDIECSSDVYEHSKLGQGLSHWQTMYIQNLEKNMFEQEYIFWHFILPSSPGISASVCLCVFLPETGLLTNFLFTSLLTEIINYR